MSLIKAMWREAELGKARNWKMDGVCSDDISILAVGNDAHSITTMDDGVRLRKSVALNETAFHAPLLSLSFPCFPSMTLPERSPTSMPTSP